MAYFLRSEGVVLTFWLGVHFGECRSKSFSAKFPGTLLFGNTSNEKDDFPLQQFIFVFETAAVAAAGKSAATYMRRWFLAY